MIKENASSQLDPKALFNKDEDILLMISGLPSDSSCMEGIFVILGDYVNCSAECVGVTELVERPLFQEKHVGSCK